MEQRQRPIEQIISERDRKELKRLAGQIGPAKSAVPRKDAPRPRGTQTVEHIVTDSIFTFTDAGNAARLVQRYCENLKFSPGRGWLRYDSKRWVAAPEAPTQAAIQSARDMLVEAARELDDTRRKLKIDHARRSLNARQLSGTVKLSESDPAVIIPPERLDSDSLLINFQNGTYDGRKNELRPHARADLITKILNADFDPEATCSAWYRFLDRVFDGSIDLIEFVQRAVGYSLTGLTSEQVFFILHGLGANGKSVFVNTLLALFCDYGCSTPADTFLIKTSDRIPNDLARLAGARLVSAVEVEGGRRLAEALVKAMTGGDKVAARFLHKEFFEFQPSFKIFLATNHKPKLRGTDHAVWRRVRLIPFRVTIPDHEQDKNLTDKLRGELSGIARWAVEGLMAWQKRGLGAAPEVTAATATYRAEQDVLGQFIAEKIEKDPEAQTTAAEVYAAYVQWCEQAGERPLRKNDLGVALAERGFESGRDNSARYWKLKVTQ